MARLEEEDKNVLIKVSWLKMILIKMARLEEEDKHV